MQREVTREMSAGTMLVQLSSAAGYQQSCDTFLLFWRALTGACSLSSWAWTVLLPLSAHTLSEAALSIVPAQLPICETCPRIKPAVLLLFLLACYFLGRSVF